MIALGADHAGFEYKERIKELLKSLGLAFEDLGTFSNESTDYPDYGHKVAEEVSSGKAEYGILVCGTGIGMSIVANKHEGVRASNVESVEAARLARQHNNANVLSLGERVIPEEMAMKIVRIWLETPFEGGRHERRVEQLNAM